MRIAVCSAKDHCLAFVQYNSEQNSFEYGSDTKLIERFKAVFDVDESPMLENFSVSFNLKMSNK